MIDTKDIVKLITTFEGNEEVLEAMVSLAIENANLQGFNMARDQSIALLRTEIQHYRDMKYIKLIKKYPKRSAC